MFLFTSFAEMIKTSPSQQYDKLGLLSNSYSFQWETNSFHSMFNKTNIDTTNVAYNFNLHEKIKYKSFLLILYNTTKYKIEKTFNILQCHHHHHHHPRHHHGDHQMIHKTNYAFNKGVDTISIPIHVNKTDKEQCKISNETSIKYTKFHNASNDYTLQSSNSSSSSSGRIIHRKHVKYRKWKEKIKSKYKTCAQLNTNNYKTISCYENMYSFDESCQPVHFNYANYVHKQFLFSQTINDGQWETFLFLINTGININTIQRMSRLCNEENRRRKHETNTIDIYPSVIDLFLNNIPLYTSTSKCNLLNSQNNTETIHIYSRILSCLLDNGANVYNLDNYDTLTLNGGFNMA
ncbi:hypothetical protein MN116_004636 [Schistosoma mekongi]|uniref:Uncharacterized protein n=1 Tax=Schistosoma mekongi TaxID=38744 RepID=A0AAE2D4L7_SCHME|nr:hypothetical protein MN116_004636 [Schistosoma mekongi]